MSTDSDDGPSSISDEALTAELESFLQRQFPQIQMHGGVAKIRNVDIDEGVVEIQLDGKCDGYGLSPMTIDAVQRRLTEDFSEIEHVVIQTQAMDVPSQTAGVISNDDDSDVPF